MSKPVKVELCNTVPSLGVNYEVDSTEPITQPLKTMNDVLSWQQDAGNKFNVARHPFTSRNHGNTPRPRTLLCHDMAGGYLEDRFVQGAKTSTYYHHYHWQYLDTFIYFSHYFVTIPPPGWTNAAHRHGVKMLGTIITEWDDGLKRCQQFLKDEKSYETLADKLVEITKFYNFDGWLINIENKIESDKVKHLHGFVKYLTEELHKAVSHSEILWYDSVIDDGSLKWQDQLNDKNRMFFDVCDGIFLNYTWNEEKLKNSVLLSGKRQYDVYVGVDVFGRNCYGGGGWNTNKAMKVIRDQKLSAAIFAPGWVYEKLGWKNFLENQDRFWTLLSEFCTPHRIGSLPLVTSFCHGYGDKYYQNGKVVKNQPWGNLSCQQTQPTEPSNQSDDDTTLQYCSDDAYIGGGCLLVRGKISEGKGSLARIFSTDIEIDHPLLVSYTYKLSDADFGGDACVYFKFNGGKKLLALADTYKGDELAQSSLSEYEISYSQKSDHLSIPGIDKLAGQCSSYSALTNDSTAALQAACQGSEVTNGNGGWTTRYFLLPASEFETHSHMEEIGVCCFINPMLESVAKHADFTLKLGRLQIVHPLSIKETLHQVADVKISDIHWKRTSTDTPKDTDPDTVLFSATLSWNYPASFASHFNVYCAGLTRNPHGNSEMDKSAMIFIGSAHVEMYRVCDLPVPCSGDANVQSIDFIIQPVTYTGFRAAMELSTKFTVQYAGNA